MQECKIFEDLQESFESTVKISHDSKIFTLTYEGNKTAVAEARSQTSDLKLVRARTLKKCCGDAYFVSMNRNVDDSADQHSFRKICAIGWILYSRN